MNGKREKLMEKIKIHVKERVGVALKIFLDEVIKKVNEGYKVVDAPTSKGWPRSYMRGQVYTCEMVKEEPTYSKSSLLEEIEETTKKVDLLNFADGLGIVIPEDVKRPTQIQAYLRKIVKEGDYID